MRTQPEITALLTHPGVIAVVRTQQPEQVLPLCAALVDGGITALEITFTVPNACEVVAAMSRAFASVTPPVGTMRKCGSGARKARTPFGPWLSAGKSFTKSAPASCASCASVGV